MSEEKKELSIKELLKADVQEVLSKHLPGMTAGALRDALRDYEQLKIDHASALVSKKYADDRVTEYFKENEKLKNQIGDIEEHKRRKENLEKDIEKYDLSVIEYNHRLEILKLKEDFSSSLVLEKDTTFNKVMDSVFGNRTLRETVLTQIPIKQPETLANCQTSDNGMCSFEDKLKNEGEVLQGVETTTTKEEK